jgi:hypothetical protein
MTPMYQQYLMVDGLKKRFESTLFDIRTLVQADLFDDELAAAEELNKKGFRRGGGAVAGVVLERHLLGVCHRHKLPIRKKDPAISDLNDALKSSNIVDIPTWRFIQHLADLRNKCDHSRKAEPTEDEVKQLIEGVRRITKTVF